MITIICMYLHGNMKDESDWELHKEDLVYEEVKSNAKKL